MSAVKARAGDIIPSPRVSDLQVETVSYIEEERRYNAELLGGVLGSRIDAPEALAWGLVDRILPAPDLMDAARALATDALAADPAHVATIKAMTRPSRA